MTSTTPSPHALAARDENVPAEATLIVATRVFCRARSGKLCRTTRGVRTHHVGFELSDGTTLVQRRSFAGRHLAIIEAARLASLVGNGIRRDVSRWDIDELARYEGAFVDATRARLEEAARVATAAIDKAYWLFSRTARGVPPAVAVPDAYAARLSAAADLRVLRSAEREVAR